MSIEQSIEQGEFEQALAQLTQATAGPQPDPGQVLMMFSVQVRLQRFQEAEATMRRLQSIAPQIAPVVERYRLAAHAEAIKQEFARLPARTVAEAAARIEALTGVRRKLSQTRLFLKKLGLKFQRVRAVPVPPKKVSTST